jgi:aminoacrylate hydrolase
MHYEIYGRQETDVPTLVCSSGLGGAGAFWTPQLPVMTQDYRVVVYDQLGTNKSQASLPEGYSINTMALELLDLLDSLNIHQCHFIGHALGGLVGLQMALLSPQRLQSQVLVNAWSSPNPHSARCFAVRQNLLSTRRTGSSPTARNWRGTTNTHWQTSRPPPVCSGGSARC